MVTVKKPTKKKEEPKQKSLLDTWMGLNNAIMNLKESEVKELLETERKGRRRMVVMLRLHARFNKLRAEREREEL